MNNPPLLVTVNETTHLLGIGRTRVYDLLRENKIEAVKIGRRTLIRYASLRALAGDAEAA